MDKKDSTVTFKDANELERAKAELENLWQSAGWKRLQGILDEKIDYLTKVINGDVQDENGSIIKSMEDLRVYRVRRDITINFRNLPDIISGMIDMGKGIDIDEILDPYGKEVKLDS